MLKKLITVAAATTVLTLAAACAGDDPAVETHTAENGDEFNDADVAFATDMIQHHAQALAMVDLTMGRNLDPPLQQLTDDIRAAQAPEIETMAGWLTDWDKPVPETMRDHTNAHGDDDMDMGSESDMAGMLSADEMSELEDTGGDQFQDVWLEMMIDHRRGAIEMAETEQDDGTFKPVIKLAESIEKSQEAEIDKMEQLLDS